jgi:vacuolar-type H+-ATPase subunit H
MSLSAIETIASAEKQAEQIIADAAAEAKQIIAGARKKGEELIENTVNKAKEDISLIEKEIINKAQAKAGEISQKTASSCDALRQKGEGNMALAVSIIVEKVVNN